MDDDLTASKSKIAMNGSRTQRKITLGAGTSSVSAVCECSALIVAAPTKSSFIGHAQLWRVSRARAPRIFLGRLHAL